MIDVKTDNDFLFGSNGREIAPLLPVRITSRQQAYRTAAWLLAMACALPGDESEATFDEVRAAVENT